MSDPTKSHDGPACQSPLDAAMRGVVDAALAYRRQGFNPTPIIGGQKAARLRAWPTTELTAEEIPRAFEPDDGVGLVMGTPPRALVCLDADGAAARFLAHRGAAPPTGMVEGRAGSPDSHWFYLSDAPSRVFRSPKTGRTIVEIRGKGSQVVVSPSLHPSGERWERSRDGEPGAIDEDTLLAAVERFAALAELLTIWPTGDSTGVRHDAARHLAGGLFRSGWTLPEVGELVSLLCEYSGDGEEADRQNAVMSTHERHEDGAPTTGWPSLVELLGEQASVDAILGWLGVTGEDLSDPRPRVLLRQGDLDKVTEETWAALVEANEPPVLFRRSNLPVTVERIDDSDDLVIRTLDDARFKHRAVEMVRFEQEKLNAQTRQVIRVPATPSLDVVRNVRVEPDPPLPILSRVTPVPVYGPSGVLQTEPGYHPDARVFYEPSRGLVLPPVPDRPTAAQVTAATDLLLEDLLGDFPFVGDADRAHALCFALLPFVRDLVDGPTPLHMFEAPKAGTGKGLAVRVLSALFVGRTGATATPAPTVDEEWRKKIHALLLEGRAHVFVDNVNDRLDSSALAYAITSEVYTDRVLGVSETSPVPVRCTWVATANNPTTSNELTRRTIRCRMNAKEEHPQLREGWRHLDLVGWTVAHRGELLAAVYTLVNAWLAAGRPRHSGPRIGSFESWSDVLGGVLATAGVPGFLGNLADFYAEADDEGAAWRLFLDAWAAEHGSASQAAGDLVPLALGAGVSLYGGDRDPSKQAASLGRELKKQLDNVYGGVVVRPGERLRGKGKTYRLVGLDGRDLPAPDPAPPSRYPSPDVFTIVRSPAGGP